MADQGNELVVIEGEKSSTGREYRKGNWTLHETLVLITAKKMDDERRMSRGSEREGRSKPAEQRWKWVEDYCWRNACMRSQNQCNDRWDNLMRDYKKVRDHERKALESGGASYWKLERHERKEKNLPSNLLPQIFEALVDVVERRDTPKAALPSTAQVSVSKGEAVHLAAIEAPSSSFMPPSHKVDPGLARPPPLLHGPVPTPAQAMPPLDIIARSDIHGFPIIKTLHLILQIHGADRSDSDASEYSNSPTKRRRKGEGSSSTSTTQELGSAISKSASMIEKALMECEENEEKRHKSLLDIEERRLKVEEAKAESSMQAINGLTEAINQLATSIFALVSERSQPPGTK